jgi:hypothetical protein
VSQFASYLSAIVYSHYSHWTAYDTAVGTNCKTVLQSNEPVGATIIFTDPPAVYPAQCNAVGETFFSAIA